MKLRGRGTNKDGDPSGRTPSSWELAARFAMASGVVLSVTMLTGSVQDGVLAVSAVAAAAQLAPRRNESP
jgi:hypothetical protein